MEEHQPDPDPEPVPHHELTGKRTTLLGHLAGAGTGSSLVVFAQSLGASPKLQNFLIFLAPWVAVSVSAISRPVAAFVIQSGRYIGLRLILRQARSLEARASGNSKISYAKNIETIESMLSDILHDASQQFGITPRRRRR